MAFWGTVLKPGKPYLHHFHEDEGRLHLSQATLGSGKSKEKTIVQCKVGDKEPINLCSLLPENLENCPLNLEFEEDEEVTFSVIGQHSVHLSGFFFGPTEDGGDSDSYEGQAIEMDSGSDDSLEYDLEDEDEDGFIDDDDDDINMYQSSTVANSGVKIEEILDDDKPTKEEATSKQSKKKKNKKGELKNSENSGKQLIVGDTSGVPILESEDEDGFPISSPSKSKAEDLTSRSDATKEEHCGEKGQKKKGKDDCDKNLKRKINVVDQDGDASREIGVASDQGTDTISTASGNEKQKKKIKKKKAANKEDLSGSASEAALIENVVKLSDTKKDKENVNDKKKNNEKLVASDAEKPSSDKNQSTSESGKKSKQLQERTYPNGLVIEELAMGKPNGKKAIPGKKIEVYYIGKLKKNGKIFYSNIGKAPFKFRLGIGQVIKGWDVGVNGMRIGDKRRLTIPPAMGYGEKGAGSAIPPNSWLVFDVELVNVN